MRLRAARRAALKLAANIMDASESSVSNGNRNTREYEHSSHTIGSFLIIIEMATTVTQVIWRTQTQHTTLFSLRQPKAPMKRINCFYDSVCSFLLLYLHELIRLAYWFCRCFYFFIYRPVLAPSLAQISPCSS